MSIPPPIHPFPARMAPELALDFCRQLRPGSVVFDPMVGSGTTLRAALGSGHKAYGIDMDPLAVLLARAWTTPVTTAAFVQRATEVVTAVLATPEDVNLSWIDQDDETSDFVEKWFGEAQRRQLRQFAAVLRGRRGATWNLCRVALSRTIITKDRGASLARDVSHSRPHISYASTDFDVVREFGRAVQLIARRLETAPVPRRAVVGLGDARRPKLDPGSVDAIITSPPYLNAIDYLRGHKLSLVWFGYRIGALRQIRSQEIGTERGLKEDAQLLDGILDAMTGGQDLPSRVENMSRRYARDMRDLVAASSRVLRPGATAVFVIGNSAVNGKFLQNDAAITAAAGHFGLSLRTRVERELPPNRRYLPPPSGDTGALSKRMRSEIVLRFTRDL